MLTLIAIWYVLLPLACAGFLAIVVLRDHLKLEHDREPCSGVWLPSPSVERALLMRCDGCGRWAFATRRLREAAADDLQMSQRMRALALEGAELLRAERERAG